MSIPDESGRRLPEAQLEETFQQTIIEDLIYPELPLRRADPEVVLVVAQTGAGTGTMHAQLTDEFRDQGSIVAVITDEFRSYHPDYQWLRALRPEALGEHTEPEARWWQDRAIQFLGARYYNIAFEDRFATPSSVLDTAEMLAGIGYRVRLAAAATPAALSRLGIIEAFARSASVTHTGPWVSAQDHDASLDAVVSTLARAEAAGAVTRITLHTHDGVLYDRQRDPTGPWESGTASSVDVLINASYEPLTRVQRTALANRLTRTLNQLADAGIGHRTIFDMAGQVAEDLAGYPLGLDGRTFANLNTAMVNVLDADTGPRDPLNTAMDDLKATNRHLDRLDLDAGPDDPFGPEPPPPEPPGPNLGPEL